jgi:hypothetical protein
VIDKGAAIIALNIFSLLLCLPNGKMTIPFSIICGTAAKDIALIRPMP